MSRHLVSVVPYRKPFESVREAVELSKGLERLHSDAKVFIKPNIVFWSKSVAFPKWGVITTSRVVQDIVRILKDYGISDISIGEGPVLMRPNDNQTPDHAFKTLGYGVLQERYGIKYFSMFERHFDDIDLGGGFHVKFNTDILQSDFVINLPVLKTHGQTKVSLGIKNLKGALDISSRKKAHNTDAVQNLDWVIARLANKLPPSFTLIDGIYSLEWGPSFEGRARRTNILVGSSDILSADLVGAKILGFDPREITHLVQATKARGRKLDLSDVNILGMKINDVARPHEYEFQYNIDGTLPLAFEKRGIQGLSYPKYDSTHCTYCSWVNGPVLFAIAKAWTGQRWDDVEVLTGKLMKPKPGMKKTILLGKCMYSAHKDNPNINEGIPVKGCPPKPEAIVRAFRKAGIELDEKLFNELDSYPGIFSRRYEGKSEFDECLFEIH